MKTYTPSEQKKRLKKAINAALIEACNEMKVLKKHYTEENFRYVVMRQISKVLCFGVFPNINKDDYLLCFEKTYEKNTFKPDIVSVKYRANGKKEQINKVNPLVIEMKINASITASDKKTKTNNKYSREIQKIKKMGSCISTDLYKVRQYLKKVDDIQFTNGVVLNIGIPKQKKQVATKDDFLWYINDLEQILRMHQKEFKNEINSSKNLLFAWFNPIRNKPELIWLNQENIIELAR